MTIAKKIMVFVLTTLSMFCVMATENQTVIQPENVLFAINTLKKTQLFYTEYVKTKQNISMLLCREILSTNDIMKKCNILFLLGSFPDSRSIPTLITNLELRNPEFDKQIKELPFIPQYPAQNALIEIGISSFPAIKKEFTTTQSKLRRDICISIVYQIYIKGLSNKMALSFLKATLLDESSETDSIHAILLKNEIDEFIKQYKNEDES